MASDFCSGPKNCTGTIINIMDTAAKTNPNGRNTRALLRSDTLPIRNLDKA